MAHITRNIVIGNFYVLRGERDYPGKPFIVGSWINHDMNQLLQTCLCAGKHKIMHTASFSYLQYRSQ